MYNHKNRYYISEMEHPSYVHRSKFIIHAPNLTYFAEFETKEQLDFFAKLLGFTYEKVEERKSVFKGGKYRAYKMSHNICDHKYFWNITEVPADAKPIKALSNGNVVTCYFHNDGDKIYFFRPNPNSKEVYNPLELNEQITFRKVYGNY